MTLDLSGIAKGYGVDRLAEVARGFGIPAALVAIDGELRALGLQPDGTAWTVAIERPDPAVRAPYAILALQDAAVATSGDYRHWVDVGDGACRTPWTPAWRTACRLRPPRSRSSPRPAWPPTPGRPP